MALVDASTRNLLSPELRTVERSAKHPRIAVHCWITEDCCQGNDHQHEEKLLTAHHNTYEVRVSIAKTQKLISHIV